MLARLTHPNVVRLLAACMTPPRFCLVMVGEAVAGVVPLPLPLLAVLLVLLGAHDSLQQTRVRTSYIHVWVRHEACGDNAPAALVVPQHHPVLSRGLHTCMTTCVTRAGTTAGVDGDEFGGAA